MRKPTVRHLLVGLLATACVCGLSVAIWNGYYRKYSPWLESKRLPDGTLPEASLTVGKRSRLIELAREFVDSHGGHIPENATTFIEETDSTYIVAFPIFRSPGDTTRGGDFHARVHIRKSDFSLLRLQGSV